jgi:hypothetical protein
MRRIEHRALSAPARYRFAQLSPGDTAPALRMGGLALECLGGVAGDAPGPVLAMG